LWFIGIFLLVDLTVGNRVPVALSRRRHGLLWIGGGVLFLVGVGLMLLPAASFLDSWLDYPVRFLFSIAGVLLAVLGAQVGGWGSRWWVRHRAKMLL
jgi:hypothetical protein